jgi:hypothetical protein
MTTEKAFLVLAILAVIMLGAIADELRRIRRELTREDRRGRRTG